MRLRHRRELPVPIETVWENALDVRKIAEAFPGGSIDQVDDDAFTGAFTVRVGPMTWRYLGEGRMSEVDPERHRAVIEAHGTERKGTARVRLLAALELSALSGARTCADLETTIDLMGAQVSLAGPFAQRISDPIVARFLDNLAGVRRRRRGIVGLRR